VISAQRPVVTLMCALGGLFACKASSAPAPEAGAEAMGTTSALSLRPATSNSTSSAGPPPPLEPVPLPDPHIAGYRMPEDASVVNGWVDSDDQVAMSRHAWGVWVALNADSGQSLDGQSLRVFETWVTPDDLLGSTNPSLLAVSRRNPRALVELRQFSRRRGDIRTLDLAPGEAAATGFVKLDPTGARWITTNKLLSAENLRSLSSVGSVPAFPSTSISLKARFVTLPGAKRYVRLPDWPGPPATLRAFPPGQWHRCVWLDLQERGAGTGNGQVDTACTDSSRTAATTYGLANFVHFQLSPEQAVDLNGLADRSLAGPTPSTVVRASGGDIAVLAGMHVTTREITRWTWATFWWTPTPDAPLAPSSTQAAAARPNELTGAPRHYAQCIANAMEKPSQPETGGKNVGESVYCYNPWLEAGFGPDALPASQPGTSHGKPVPNNVGVETNCMSCHAQARFPAKPAQGDYAGDRYVDLASPDFKGSTKVDFLWSIADFAR